MNRKITKFVVSGNSMLPLFKNGDIVPVNNSTGPLKKGNCYLFNYNSKLIIHRLIKIENNHYHFIGDNSGKIQTVSADKIVGTPCILESKISIILITIINNIFIVDKKVFPIYDYIRRKFIKILHFLIKRITNERKI